MMKYCHMAIVMHIGIQDLAKKFNKGVINAISTDTKGVSDRCYVV